MSYIITFVISFVIGIITNIFGIYGSGAGSTFPIYKLF
jgi:hypothetical protein